MYSPEKEAGSVNYKLLDRIGTGAFSEVWRASVIAPGSNHDGAHIAVKEIDAVTLHKEGRCDPQRVVSEIHILARLRHPNIVRM